MLTLNETLINTLIKTLITTLTIKLILNLKWKKVHKFFFVKHHILGCNKINNWINKLFVILARNRINN